MVPKLTFSTRLLVKIIGVTISLPLFLKNISGILVKERGKNNHSSANRMSISHKTANSLFQTKKVAFFFPQKVQISSTEL